MIAYLSFWKDVVLLDSPASPSAWGSWRGLIENFDLVANFPLPAWVPAIQWRMGNGSPLPPSLAQAATSSLSTLLADFSPQSKLHLIWRPTVVAFADPSASDASRPAGPSRRSETFLRNLKATDLKSHHAAFRVSLSCQRLRLPRVFSAMGHAATLKTLRKAGVLYRR